jgi:hypothetical protein
VSVVDVKAEVYFQFLVDTLGLSVSLGVISSRWGSCYSTGVVESLYELSWSFSFFRFLSFSSPTFAYVTSYVISDVHSQPQRHLYTTSCRHQESSLGHYLSSSSSSSLSPPHSHDITHESRSSRTTYNHVDTRAYLGQNHIVLRPSTMFYTCPKDVHHTSFSNVLYLSMPALKIS